MCNDFSNYGFEYLDNLIHSDSGYVNLEQDILMKESELDFYGDGIEIDTDLIIDGNGHTIDANGLSRIFTISGNVVLKNIIFATGRYSKNTFDNMNDGGGALYLMPASTVEMEAACF